MRLKGGQQLSTTSVPSPRLSSKISLTSNILLIGIFAIFVSLNLLFLRLSLLDYMDIVGNLLFNVIFLYLIHFGISNRPYSKLIFGIGLIIVMTILALIATISSTEDLDLHVTWWMNLAIWIVGLGWYIFVQIQDVLVGRAQV